MIDWAFAFHLVTSRRAKAEELAIILSEFEDRRREFNADAALGTQYLAGGGARKPAKDLNQIELAAYAATCSLIINLDESLSK